MSDLLSRRLALLGLGSQLASLGLLGRQLALLGLGSQLALLGLLVRQLAFLGLLGRQLALLGLGSQLALLAYTSLEETLHWHWLAGIPEETMPFEKGRLKAGSDRGLNCLRRCFLMLDLLRGH